jgi:hypothetical protein
VSTSATAETRTRAQFLLHPDRGGVVRKGLGPHGIRAELAEGVVQKAPHRLGHVPLVPKGPAQPEADAGRVAAVSENQSRGAEERAVRPAFQDEHDLVVMNTAFESLVDPVLGFLHRIRERDAGRAGRHRLVARQRRDRRGVRAPQGPQHDPVAVEDKNFGHLRYGSRH